jgi:hypothetical protein
MKAQDDGQVQMIAFEVVLVSQRKRGAAGSGWGQVADT